MKKIYSLLIVLLFVGSAFAQGKTAVIKHTATAPEIDGFIEDTWEPFVAQPVDVNYKTEVPTIGSSTWQALYDDANFYVVVFADDDNHWPKWKSGGANEYEYDKCEVYWDVNAVLEDGVGAGTNTSGHYQLAPGFLDGSYDMAITVAQTAVGDRNPGGTYAYSLVGDGYIYEMAVPMASFTDKDGNPAVIKGATWGFDVTIIDQDEGITTARQRNNWSNAGAKDENWGNMDDAGHITFEPVGVNTLKIRNMSVSSRNGNLSINADFNKVVISNILGQQVKSSLTNSKTVNISDLSKGVYVVKAYKNNAYVGTAKFTQN
jgi:hypothetical protein